MSILSEIIDQGDHSATFSTTVIPPLHMPGRPATRKACAKLPRYKNSATLSQRVAALRRHIVWGDSFAAAVAHVNAQSGTLAKECIISETTLRRIFHSLPPHLQLAINADEAALMGFIQEQESSKRSGLKVAFSYLTHLEEELLAQWVTEMQKINLPVDSVRVIEEARRIVRLQRDKEITGSMEKWWRGFKKRHSGLTERICQNISKQRISAQLNTANIAHYFSLLAQYVHLPPNQIYAGDETGLDGDGDRVCKVVVQGGTQRVTQQFDSYREHTSLMHIGNAAGESLPIAFIFKGKSIDHAMAPFLPANALVGCQENGYFIGAHFLRILQHLDQHGTKDRPLLFIIDGAKAHIDYEALEFAVGRGIQVLCLPSHTTHILQVADVALFGPFKTLWRSGCQRLKRGIGKAKDVNGPRGIRRTDIVPLVLEAWSKAMTPENIKSGFRRTGIYPFDPHAYRHTKQQQLKSLGGLPLILTPQKQLMEVPSIAAAVDNTPPVIAPSPVKAGKCGECGSSLKKREVRRTISTQAGVLLTGESLRAQIREAKEDKEKEEREKEEKRRKREENKRKREEEANHGVKKKRGQQRKVGETGEEDKENVHPNVVVTALPERPVMTLLKMHPGFTVIAMPTFN
jgi:hypothetical protein